MRGVTLLAAVALIGCEERKVAVSKGAAGYGTEHGKPRSAPAPASTPAEGSAPVDFTPEQKATALRQFMTASMNAELQKTTPGASVKATGAVADIFEVELSSVPCSKELLRVYADAAGRENMRKVGFKKVACRKGGKLISIRP